MSDSADRAAPEVGFARGDREIPLSVPVLTGREIEYVTQAIESGWLSTGGPFITRFEDEVRAFTGAKHAIACASGTAALHVLMQMAGVGHGDAVIVPTLTFIATVNPVAYLGAHPVFIGCDDFMNLDPDLVRAFLAEECSREDGQVVERASGRRIAALVAVHVFGNPCRLDALAEIAEEYGIPLIEDAAESLGSTWTAGPLAGRHTGTVALAGALSFNANKIITSGGGGMILTQDDALAERARYLITTAKDDAVRFRHGAVGYNYRLTNMAAAFGLAQMESLPSRLDTKRANYERYKSALAGVEGTELMGVPEGTRPNYWFYSLLVDPAGYGHDREWLMEQLRLGAIQTRPVWYLNHKQQPYLQERAYSVERAEWFWERVLNLPCSTDLLDSDIDRVADVICRPNAQRGVA